MKTTAKTSPLSPVSPAPVAVTPIISHGQIAARAFELWEADGRPEGHDLAFWYEAERQLSLPLTPPGTLPLNTAKARRPAIKASDVDGLAERTEEMLENVGETDNYSATSLGELTRKRY